jgi:hypothetical protein
MIGDWLRRLVDTAAFRPALTVYVASVAVSAAVADNRIRVEVGMAALGFVALLTALASMHREVEKVHTLVNSQRDELVARITQLTAALVDTGQRVPTDPAEEDR